MISPTDSIVRYVVDASVATKWHLRDEADTDVADTLLGDFRDDRIALLAPDHIRYEVPSAIRKAMRTKRLTDAQARTAIADFLAWQVPVVGGDDLIVAAYDSAGQFGCSFYDGLYVALAVSTGCPLVYADSRLRNALRGHSAPAIWLTDYTSPPR